MRRRDLITVIGGIIGGWPSVARAQQKTAARRVSVMLIEVESDPDAIARSEAFRQAMERFGWGSGSLQIDMHWGLAAPDRIREAAIELATLGPDVIVASGVAHVVPLLQATRTIPVVFVLVADPVGAGFVDSLAHPGGNATGFTAVDYSFGPKWLELLKQIAPGVSRVAVLRDQTLSVGIGLLGAIQSAASAMGVEVVPVGARDTAEIEKGITNFVRGAGDGIIVTASPAAFANRDVIVALAARHKLPAVYPARPFVASGGLAAYAPNIVEEYRLAAGYVDRLLKGTRAAELPVQNPNKYEMTINLKTAKALGVAVPDKVLAAADEVIE